MKKSLSMLKFAIVAIIIYYGGPCSGAWSDAPEYRKPFLIPPPPENATLVIYGPLPAGILGIEAERARDWKKILTKKGVQFPSKGFALFYGAARVLVVATDATNQNLVETLLE